MNPRFVCVALLAAIGTAAAGDAAERIRSFIDALRSEEARRESQVVVPDVELPTNLALDLESRVGHHVVTYELLQFDAEGDAVRVLRMRFVTHLPDIGPAPFAKPGLNVEEARVPRAAYDAFVHGLLLLGSSRLEPRAEAIGGHVGGSLFLKVGDALCTEVTVPNAPPSEILRHGIDDSGRGLLWFRFAATRARTWKFEELADPGEIAGHLLRGLPTSSGWRRDLRVLALGWLGHKPALTSLKGLNRSDGFVNLAIHQIELVAECDTSSTPPAVFQKLLNWDYPGVSEWALELLKSRYPGAYKEELKKLFASPDPEDRVSAVVGLERFDASDHTLARAALTDTAAEVRVEAARILEETDPLLAIVADRELRTEAGRDARCAAMIYLSWEYPPKANPKRLVPTLVAVARDASADARVRHSAAVALGHLGSREAIPALLELLTHHPTEDENIYDLRSGAAEALGYLRARRAVKALVGQFEAPPQTYRVQRQELGKALARIGDPLGLKSLKKAVTDAKREHERSYWQSCVTYAESIQARDARTLLKRGLGGGCPAYVVILLADLFDGDELRRFLDEDWVDASDRKFINHAISLRERS